MKSQAGSSKKDKKIPDNGIQKNGIFKMNTEDQVFSTLTKQRKEPMKTIGTTDVTKKLGEEKSITTVKKTLRKLCGGGFIEAHYVPSQSPYMVYSVSDENLKKRIEYLEQYKKHITDLQEEMKAVLDGFFFINGILTKFFGKTTKAIRC